MNEKEVIEVETSGFDLLNEVNSNKLNPKPVVQEILKDSISNSAFDSPTLENSECYSGNDLSATDSCMSLPASTVLLSAKPFKSRIPVRRGGATTPSDFDRMSTCSGRSTPTFHNSIDPMTSSLNTGYVNINYESREDLTSSTHINPPTIAPKPTYIKGQIPRRLNKMSLKRETSLPPLAFGTMLSQNVPSKMKREPLSKQHIKPRYERSNSSMSMYEERKKSREMQRSGVFAHGLPLNTSSRRGSIDNFYVGGDVESVSSTRCSTPNRLMGSMSKIPVWTGSQEKLSNLKNNTSTPLQKNTAGNRMLPPIPNKPSAVTSSGGKVYGTTKVKKLATKKWESLSSLESTMDTTASQFLQDGRYKNTSKTKASPSRSSELTEKSRQLTESLKQLQQSYSSSNIQADLKLKDKSPMKEDATLHFGSIQQLKKVETITKVGDSSNSPSIEFLRHQLEEKDQLIASLRKSIENGSNYAIGNGENDNSHALDEREKDQTNDTMTEMKRIFKEKEEKLISELQDAKDQAELLEFRVLELEEEQEKQKHRQDNITDTKSRAKDQSLEFMMDKKLSDTQSISGDSGCNLSTTTETSDLTELYQDFRNEKVADTKSRLHELMCHISGPSDKSLLLQTVALFETLLSKIKELQNDNAKLKSDQQDFYERKQLSDENMKKIHSDRDQLVLELEESQNKLNIANKSILQLTESTNSHEEHVKSLATDLNRMDAKNAQLQSIHAKQESDLKKQIIDLKAKLESANCGRQAESEMYEEAMVKTQRLETMVNELNAKNKVYEEDISELRDQLSSALEHQTTKSVGSLGSDDFRSTDHHHHSKIPSVLSDSSSHHSSENESSQHGLGRKVVGSSSSGVSSDLSDPDSDGGHDDERRRILEHHDADDEVDENDSFVKPKVGNKRKKEKLMVEISTQTKEDQSPVTMIALEMDQLNTSNMCHEKLYPSNVNSRRSVEEVLLDDVNYEKLREDFNDLNKQKIRLEQDLEAFKEDKKEWASKKNVEIEQENVQKIVYLQNIENALRNQLDDWEKKYIELQEKNRILLEEKCEIEEAENDSRLQAQRLEQQNSSAYERNQLLSEELIQERKTSAILRNELDQINAQNAEAPDRYETSRLESMLQRYEQRVFDLEELEVELREKISGLRFAFQTLYWFWTYIIMTSGCIIPSRPMLGYVNHSGVCHEDPSLLSKEKEKLEYSQIKAELEELKTKEVAYKETLKKGDSILEKVQADYQLIINKLENENQNLKVRVSDQQGRNERNSPNHELLNTPNNDAYASLSRKLILSEKNENEMKSRMGDLERREKELNERLSEQKQSYNDLVNQLEDHDLALKKIASLEHENSGLLDQVEHLKEVERRFKEVHQSEEFLHGRVEELEQTESVLRKELTTVDRRFSDRECKWQRKVDDLQDELNLQQELKSETSSNQFLSLSDQDPSAIKRAHEGRHSLRIQVEGLKQTVDVLNKELEDKNDQMKSCEASLRSEVSNLRNQLSFANNQLKDFDDINAKLKDEIVKIKANFEHSENEIECLKLQGEQNLIKHIKALEEKDSRISDLQLKLDKAQSDADEDNLKDKDDFREMDSMEGGLVDVRNQVEIAAEVIKGCKDCAPYLYKKLDDVSQQISTISQAICSSSNANAVFVSNTSSVDRVPHQFQQSGFTMMNSNSNTIHVTDQRNCSIVDTDLFKRCESEEQLLDAPGDIDSDLSTGKISQLARHRTTIQVNNSVEKGLDDQTYEEQLSIDVPTDLNEGTIQSKMLNEMQLHLNQMEQELAIVSEESKDLQQRLIDRQKDVEKKSQEARDLVGVVEHLRYSNLRTSEQLERSKNRADSISCRLEETRANFQQLETKAANKDFLIITIIDLLLSQIEDAHSCKRPFEEGGGTTTQEKSASYFVKRLRQTTVRPSKLRGCGVLGGKNGGGTIDFNLEVLCSYIESEGRRRRRENNYDEESSLETMQEDKIKKTSHPMFSLSTFSSKSKESSHAFNKQTYHHQPISLSGLPMTSIGNPSMSQSTDFSSNGKMSKNEHKFPLLNSSGIAPTLMTPSNFRVTRRVGSDSLLVAWTTPDDDDITGYLIYVNEVLHQKVRSSSRTKALLHDMDLNSKLKLGIHSIGIGGTVSNITFAIYDPKICVRRSASFSTTHPSMSSSSMKRR